MIVPNPAKFVQTEALPPADIGKIDLLLIKVRHIDGYPHRVFRCDLIVIIK